MFGRQLYAIGGGGLHVILGCPGAGSGHDEFVDAEHFPAALVTVHRRSCFATTGRGGFATTVVVLGAGGACSAPAFVVE